MEISTRHQGRGVHLLAYCPDPTYPPLAAELQKVLDGRASRVPTMLDRLGGLGIDITEDDVRAASARRRGHRPPARRRRAGDARRGAGPDRGLRPLPRRRAAGVRRPLRRAARARDPAGRRGRRRLRGRAPVGPRRTRSPRRGDLRELTRARPGRDRGRPPGPRRPDPRAAARDRAQPRPGRHRVQRLPRRRQDRPRARLQHHRAGGVRAAHLRPSDWNRCSTPFGTTRAAATITLYCGLGIDQTLPLSWSFSAVRDQLVGVEPQEAGSRAAARRPSARGTRSW